jgi:excisionase family DNA binding protein
VNAAERIPASIAVSVMIQGAMSMKSAKKKVRMKELSDDEKLLTLKQALDYLQIGRTTLYKLMDEGKLKAYRVGGTWRFYLGELRSFVSGNGASAEAKDAADKSEQR